MEFFKFSSSSFINHNINLDYALPGQLGFQFPASPIMRGIIDLHNHIMFLLVFIVVFTFIMLYYTLSNFTINNNDEFEKFNKIKNYYDVKLNHHSLLETIWIIVPSLILMSIALPSFALLHAMEIMVDSTLILKVTGHQWYWSYEVIYQINPINSLENISSCVINFDSYMIATPELENNHIRLLSTTCPIILPVQTYVKVIITSSDVLHSWALPSLGIKVDACPGRLNQALLYVDRVGHFFGQCSELCGVNHGFMPIELYAVPLNEFYTYLTFVSSDYREYCVNYAMDIYLNIFKYILNDENLNSIQETCSPLEFIYFLHSNNFNNIIKEF